MKGRRGLQKLITALSIVTGLGAFVILIMGTQDFALGLGTWLCFASLALLILWVGDRIMEALHDTGEDSE